VHRQSGLIKSLGKRKHFKDREYLDKGKECFMEVNINNQTKIAIVYLIQS
jgi:hypothetical protein